MSRAQLIAFLRALVATLAAGLVLWFLAKLGVHIPVPLTAASPPQL